MSEKHGDFLNVYEDGEIKVDGKVDIETGLVQAVFVKTDLLGDLMVSQFECVNGDILPVCLKCHKHVLASKDECSNEFCLSDEVPDAEQISMFL